MIYNTHILTDIELEDDEKIKFYIVTRTLSPTGIDVVVDKFIEQGRWDVLEFIIRHGYGYTGSNVPKTISINTLLFNILKQIYQRTPTFSPMSILIKNTRGISCWDEPFPYEIFAELPDTVASLMARVLVFLFEKPEFERFIKVDKAPNGVQSELINTINKPLGYSHPKYKYRIVPGNIDIIDTEFIIEVDVNWVQLVNIQSTNHYQDRNTIAMCRGMLFSVLDGYRSKPTISKVLESNVHLGLNEIDLNTIAFIRFTRLEFDIPIELLIQYGLTLDHAIAAKQYVTEEAMVRNTIGEFL